MAHLPITITAEFVECRLDLVSFEGAECNDDAPSDRRLPRNVVQDGRQAALVPKFAQRGNGFFDHEGISVRLRDGNDFIEEFGEAVCPDDVQGSNDAQVVRIVKAAFERSAQLERPA